MGKLRTELGTIRVKQGKRAGEGEKIPLRTDRFCSAQGDWYSSTREGAPIGPFENKREANTGLNDFIEFMTLAEPKTLSRLYSTLAS